MNQLLEKLIEEGIVEKRNNRYYSMCAVGEEITIEIKKIFKL